MKNNKINHVFVSTIPDDLEEGHLYISLDYGVAIHKCACGCGEEVVTPLSPDGWSMTYNGESITLSPSIGNWSFRCKSHYWIRSNKIIWEVPWSIDQIENNRKSDRHIKKGFFKKLFGR